MHNVKKNNAVDYTKVKGTPKIAGMQCNISSGVVKERERLEKINKRNVVLKYATECLKKGEDIKKVLIKSKIYAAKLKIDVNSITEPTIEMLLKKIQMQEECMER